MGYQIVTWPMTSRDPQKVLWGSTVGYLIDSLASCYVYWRRRALHAIYMYATGYILSEYRQTSIHTFQWLLGYDETGDFWKHWNCVAHFRYRGSIEYRDTWGGIVIVAPISGIAQHYFPVSAANLWNSLPAHHTSSPSLTVFWQRLKTFLLQREHPEILAEIGEGYGKKWHSAYKAPISLKSGKIGPRTNRKSHTRFRLLPKLTTLIDLEES